MLDRRTRTSAYDAWLLLALALLLIGSGLGLRDPWPADEPRFALIAREMVESGQWFFPTRGGNLYADKPPLFMWMIAFFYHLTGQMNIAFLLPSLLAGAGTVLLVRNLGERLWDRDTGFVAGLILLATLQFTAQARTAQIDAVVCFFITLGLYGMLRHMLVAPSWKWYFLGGFSAGLGVITKGVGFLPLLVLVPYLLLHRRLSDHTRLARRDWRWLLALAGTLLAISLWVVPMWLTVDRSGDPGLMAYRDEILFRQTLDRYADPWHHFKPWHYFFSSVIPWAWFPTVWATPWLVGDWRAALKGWDARFVLLLAWILLVLVFFSFSPAKRGVYVLPAVPALALLVAQPLRRHWSSPRLQLTAWSAGLLWVALSIVAALAFAFELPAVRSVSDQLEVSAAPFFILLAVTGVAVMATRSPACTGGSRLGVLIAMLWLIYGWVGYPVMNPQRSYRSFMQTVAEHIGPTGELGMVESREKMLLYADRPVTNFGFYRPLDEQLAQASGWLDKGSNRWLLLPREASDRCATTEGEIRLGGTRSLEWVLLTGCAFP